jgi:O-antigen ligase
VAWFIAVVFCTITVFLPQVQGSQTVREGVLRSGTLADRENYWSAALPVVTSSAHNLIFGIGTGVAEASEVSTNVMVPAALAATPTLIDRSLHNEYVTTLVEQGAIGVCALIAFLAAGLIPTARLARSKGNPVDAALAASMISLAVVMTVDTALLHGPSFAVLMLCAGLAANAVSAAARPRHNTGAAGRDEP